MDDSGDVEARAVDYASSDGDVDETASAITDSNELTRQQHNHKEHLAEKETKTLRRLKCIVFSLLFCSMMAVAFTAYYVTARQETVEFEKQYYENAHKVLSTMGSNLERTLQASDAFVASIASMAELTNQTWPFVVVPDFAVRAEKIRSLANAVVANTYAVIQPEERSEWERFSALAGESFVEESLTVMEEYDDSHWPIIWNYTAWNVIWAYDEYDKENPGEEGTTREGTYMPWWQAQPTIPAAEPVYNWDLLSDPGTNIMNMSGPETTIHTHKVVVTDAYMIAYEDDFERIENNVFYAEFFAPYLPPGVNAMEPASDIYYPIFEDSHKGIKMAENDDREAVGVFCLSVYWRDTVKKILPDGSNGLLVVFTNPCNPTWTYQINGPEAVFLGAGDAHEERYDSMGMSSLLTELGNYAIGDTEYSGLPINEEFCPYTIHIYPSSEMEQSFKTNTPLIFALVTALVFVGTAMTFLLYDFWVERRQRVVMKTAIKSSALVSSLFPTAVAKKMMAEHEELPEDTQPKSRLKSFLNDGKRNDNVFDHSEGSLDNSHQSGLAKGSAKPIAELFPETTVFFADIAGFTAWSSSREPSHVFLLLETLYGAFDQIAKRFGIFKVETIGDSYVAVSGLPEPRAKHAIAMAKFAVKCVERMKQLTRELELTLGPGTGDLCLRVGLHSGPTIAGVLRGEKARFQLFGDTVNTASRMESTSLPNKIQVSQKTAELVIAHGKGNWLSAREDLVNAKGKGQLQTYWLNIDKAKPSSVVSSLADLETESTVGSSTEVEGAEEKIERLVDWNVALFEELLEEIVSHRQQTPTSNTNSNTCLDQDLQAVSIRKEAARTICMPHYESASLAKKTSGTDSKVPLDSDVLDQLRKYITTIADLYTQTNAFHGFEHASHVIMSTTKLMHRIATQDVKKKEVSSMKAYYDSTFGLGSDPLTKFAVVFSALIHDVDHQGVSNGQLVKENDPIAETYGSSCMEQHSFNVAWELLMEPAFKDLRDCIYENNQVEYQRFRQICVNCLIATDIFDKDLKEFREARWNRAFRESKVGNHETALAETWNSKATIIIEYVIQASDVAHTMQHWHVYQRWNARLFREMRTAYLAGRMEKDPADSWYQGELWFFECYVIPLAKKLRECEVFGVACDEFLDFATQNRMEWEAKGEQIVKDLVQSMQ
ncbi:MAG: hypothetical protein SGILL_004724 [Bacillariaceae sp.]